MKSASLSFFLTALLSPILSAQTGTLRGQVTDESGAIVPGTSITLAGPGDLSKTTTAAANDASYSFADLPLGAYTLQASAPGLNLRQPTKISLKAGLQSLNLVLSVAAENRKSLWPKMPGLGSARRLPTTPVRWC